VEKSLPASYLLWAFLGPWGAHRFYLRDYGWGVIYLLTGGLFLVGWFIDAFTLPGQVDRANRALAGDGLAPARLVSSGPSLLADPWPVARRGGRAVSDPRLGRLGEDRGLGDDRRPGEARRPGDDRRPGEDR
jgi:TM2 domain-containing membrane protein YozV